MEKTIIKKAMKAEANGSNGSEGNQRLKILKTYKIYIDGKFPRTESGRYFVLKNPQGEAIANLCRSSAKDVRDSVVAARKAQSSWSGRSAYNRSQILYRIAEMMEGRRTQFIDELQQIGFSLKASESEINSAIDCIVYYAGWCDKYQQVFSSVNPVESSHFNFSLPEATGVVTILCAETQPILGLVSLLAPVIAGGNTCIVLASEKIPHAAITFAEVLHSSDLPAGVVNILTGFRSELSSSMSTHMDVNAILASSASMDEKKTIQVNASINVKRAVFYDEKDWGKVEVHGPYRIMDFQEIKTTWHPVGV